MRLRTRAADTTLFGHPSFALSQYHLQTSHTAIVSLPVAGPNSRANHYGQLLVTTNDGTLDMTCDGRWRLPSHRMLACAFTCCPMQPEASPPSDNFSSLALVLTSILLLCSVQSPFPILIRVHDHPPRRRFVARQLSFKHNTSLLSTIHHTSHTTHASNPTTSLLPAPLSTHPPCKPNRPQPRP